MPESVAARLSISGSVSSLMAATMTSAPRARAASSRRKGKRPLPAIRPSLPGEVMVFFPPFRKVRERMGHPDPVSLQHSALGAFDELHEVGDVPRLDALFLELLDRLRGVHLCRQQQSICALDGAQAALIEAPAFESNFIQTVCVGFPLRGSQGEWKHILGDRGSTAGVSVPADAAVLVNLVERADGGVVLDYDVTGERGGIGQDAAIPDHAVMSNVRVSHDEAIAANTRCASAAGGSARDRHAFADDVVVAQNCACRLSLVLQVLGCNADAGKGKEAIAGSDCEVSVENHVRDQLAVLSQNDVGPDG